MDIYRYTYILIQASRMKLEVVKYMVFIYSYS